MVYLGKPTAAIRADYFKGMNGRVWPILVQAPSRLSTQCEHQMPGALTSIRRAAPKRMEVRRGGQAAALSYVELFSGQTRPRLLSDRRFATPIQTRRSDA